MNKLNPRMKAAAHAAAGLLAIATYAQAGADTAKAPPKDAEIRPFNVAIPQSALDDLRRRVAATRWPSSELVKDRSQCVQLATLQ